MALSPGIQIGPYRIVDQIGSGGMGEVYRATDTKLGRDVAIKTLPNALAKEPERLARFEREAKLLATLNHAHIGAIYGLDEHEGTQFIAMELVEGQTLADKLKDGPLPVEDALEIARQIAEALEAAHEKGVVHRDLKPANIMLTADGVVKVLDFGLAKAFSGNPNEASPAHSPALSMAMTQQGLILGTAGYMSPEQASGQATDQRADIWAFGVVLYEMLTGLPLFSGESVPHILADVLRTEPDWNRLPKHLHPRLKLLLKRCLEKKPRGRCHAIADARIEIEDIQKNPEVWKADSQAAPLTNKQPVLRWIALTAVLTATVVGAAAFYLRAVPDAPAITRFDYDLPDGQTIGNANWPMIAISPDGRRFVYNTNNGMYLRDMEKLEAVLISGTQNGLDTITFSPDAQALAYWSVPGELRRIATSGGAAVPIAETGGLFGISWQSDGQIYYAERNTISRIAANGGTPEQLVAIDDGSLLGAELLPDGDSLMFSIATTPVWDAAQIVVQSLSTGERTVLIEGGVDARYVSTGHIVYALGDQLFARPFDVGTLTVSGGAVPVVQGINRSPGGQSGLAHYDISENGTLIYLAGDIGSGTRTLVWVDREGHEEPIGAPLRAYTSPRISPDGSKVALNLRDQDVDIWVWDLARETLTRLTFGSQFDRFPLWSADGQRIAYESQTDGGSAVSWRSADGSDSAEQLALGEGELYPHSFVSSGPETDEGIVVYGDFGGGNSNEDIAFVPLDGSQTIEPLLEEQFAEQFPAVSPDGHWLAYVSNESGRQEVYVRPFPGVNGGGRWQVSTNGGTQPLWSTDGTEIFYRDGDAMVAVPVESDQTFVPGNPTVLFEGEYSSPLGGRTFDVSPIDGRFLMIKDGIGPSAQTQIVVVENWSEELKRMVPTE